MPHDSYFQGNPTRLDISRSKFHRSPRWWGSWNTGKLFPIFATSSVMPGDTFRMSVSSAIRMVRPAFPVMDDMDITIEAYFVPHRLVLSRKSMSPDVNDSVHSWSAFIGAQDSLLNMPTPGDVKLPVFGINFGNPDTYKVGGLADCLAYHKPDAVGAQYFVNPLKVLAFYSVWNEYFREPNCQNPVTYSITTGNGQSPTGNFVSLTGSDANITAGSTYITSIDLPPVSRYHGYFGSALPWPQRNSTQVEMPLGDTAPVYTSVDENPNPANVNGYSTALRFRKAIDWTVPNLGSDALPLLMETGLDGSAQVKAGSSGIVSGNNYYSPSNLFADLSEATAASVNEFRLAVQTQRWYEALARSGNKYSDLVHGMFGVRGVSIPDRPEYLGGFTAPINMTQVNDTASSLGQTGAFSLSNPGGYLFTKSFTEHGTIIVVACCRVKDSYSQGIQREDTRFDRFDFYWPQFANLGEQPILKKELYIDNVYDDEVFGYQEAWAEYRMFNDAVTGAMNPSSANSIAGYTYANVFSSAPTLKGYLDASAEVDNVDRTLTADHTAVGFQFFGNFEFQIDMVRPMPTYSIPGLVDHH